MLRTSTSSGSSCASDSVCTSLRAPCSTRTSVAQTCHTHRGSKAHGGEVNRHDPGTTVSGSLLQFAGADAHRGRDGTEDALSRPMPSIAIVTGKREGSDARSRLHEEPAVAQVADRLRRTVHQQRHAAAP